MKSTLCTLFLLRHYIYRSFLLLILRFNMTIRSRAKWMLFFLTCFSMTNMISSLQFLRFWRNVQSLLRSMGLWMGSTDCRGSPQISSVSGTLKTSKEAENITHLAIQNMISLQWLGVYVWHVCIYTHSLISRVHTSCLEQLSQNLCYAESNIVKNHAHKIVLMLVQGFYLCWLNSHYYIIIIFFSQISIGFGFFFAITLADWMDLNLTSRTYCSIT